MKFITGLELSKKYFEQYGKPMLFEKFSGYINQMAVGLVGHGSECFGFDDNISTDHDYEAGFSIWLPEKTYREIGFDLMREYAKLPDTFLGVEIQNKSAFGADTKGVRTIEDFYSFYLGSPKEPQSLKHWLSIPSYYLAEATNGRVYFDNFGEFSRIRNILLNEMPDDVWNKKLASSLFLMAQSGQYNYSRCQKHGELGASVFALNEFAKNLIDAVFILNKKHCPYYKWSLRAMKSLEILANYSEKLESVLLSPTDSEKVTAFIEQASKDVIEVLVKNGYSQKGDYLEPYAYMVQDSIKDNELRNSSVIL